MIKEIEEYFYIIHWNSRKTKDFTIKVFLLFLIEKFFYSNRKYVKNSDIQMRNLYWKINVWLFKC